MNNKEIKSNLGNYFWAVVLIAAGALWVYRGGCYSPVVLEADIPRISAPDLMSEYQENEIAADLKYKGKEVVVSGMVTARAKDIVGDIYVALNTASPLFSVQCFFNNSEARRIAAIRIGSELSIRGRVNGKMGNVILKDCRLVN